MILEKICTTWSSSNDIFKQYLSDDVENRFTLEINIMTGQSCFVNIQERYHKNLLWYRCRVYNKVELARNIVHKGYVYDRGTNNKYYL